MDLKTGHSYSDDARLIVEEATADFSCNPGTILFFSPLKCFDELNVVLSEKYPGTQIIGASTNYSFCDNRMQQKDQSCGTVIVDFGDGFDCFGGVIEEVCEHPVEYIFRVRECLNKLDTDENTVCLEFTTAFYGAEELVLDTFASALEGHDIPVAGSSCGNEDWGNITCVSYNGRVYHNACVFLFVHNRQGRIAILKQELYEPTRKYFTADSVDVKKRVVYELNGQPAAEVLAKELHYELFELPDHFAEYALGRAVGEDIYSTDFVKITREKGLEMFASVFGGTRMCILNRGKYNSCLSNVVAQIRKSIPEPRFVLYINCMSLTKFYRQINWLDVFNMGLGSASEVYAGISGYGEQLGRIHVNKTLVAVAFE